MFDLRIINAVITRIAWLLLFALVLSGPVAAASSAADDSSVTSGFGLRIDSRETQGHVAAAFVMPNAVLTLHAQGAAENARLTLETGGHGVIETAQAQGWTWRAPATPGLYTLTIHDAERRARLRLNVFVKTPFDNTRDTLEGYRIGGYEPEARPGDAASAPPPGLVQVTPENRDTRISPHFTLGQFLCHQQPDHWPKYVLVRPLLLDKLERLHSALVAAGVTAPSITVMSGFRTPWYNADIGNTTVYSQHLFGSAADIFVDANGDDRMDDLNGDGTIDSADARWLADLVETITAETPALQGGLSVYPANSRHGPFVHIDVRGVPARW